MHRAPIAAALAAALVAAPALAEPVGAPSTVRQSRAGDERAHPGARTEYWVLQLVEQRTRRVVLVRLRRADGYPGATVVLPSAPDRPRSLEPALTFRSGNASGATFAGPDGAAAQLSWRPGGVTLTLEAPGLSGRVALRGRAGPFAAAWDLGDALRYPQARAERVRVSYNVPVATGRARGSFRMLGDTLRVNGWRGSLEHVWGSFALDDWERWAHWDAYVVQRGRTAWLAFGMNRRDAVLGPGARDGQWAGVLARVGPRGTRICRPRVHRRRWAIGLPLPSDPVPYRLLGRCRGLRADFRDGRRPSAWLPGDSYIAYEEQVHTARVGGRGWGSARHVRYPG